MGMISKWESVRIRYLCIMYESFLFLWLLRFIERKKISSIASAVSDSDKQKPNFTIFRHLQRTLLDMLGHVTLLVTCCCCNVHIFIYFLEKECPMIFVLFFTDHRLWVLGFIAFKTMHFSICIFLKWLLWVFKRERMSLPLKRDLTIVSR